MEFALKEAELAYKRKEVPVGAILVKKGRIIGKGYNQVETLRDPTAHAEMIAITAGAAQLGNHRLGDCTLYVTLEPCAMCAGAIILSRIQRLVYGAADPKGGACGTLFNITQDERLNHQVTLTKGVMEPECTALLKEFFAKVRSNGMGKP
jgi:tRNA(adenine34) deaminase